QQRGKQTGLICGFDISSYSSFYELIIVSVPHQVYCAKEPVYSSSDNLNIHSLFNNFFPLPSRGFASRSNFSASFGVISKMPSSVLKVRVCLPASTIRAFTRMTLFISSSSETM